MLCVLTHPPVSLHRYSHFRESCSLLQLTFLSAFKKHWCPEVSGQISSTSAERSWPPGRLVFVHKVKNSVSLQESQNIYFCLRRENLAENILPFSSSRVCGLRSVSLLHLHSFLSTCLVGPDFGDFFTEH